MSSFTAAIRVGPVRGMRPGVGEGRRTEHLIGIVRLFFATSALLMIWYAPTEPAIHASNAVSVLAAYVAFSALTFPVSLAIGADSWTATAFLGFDVAFAVALTSLTNGPASPLFPFLLLGPLSAAIRSGARETLAASGAALAAILAQTIAVGHRTRFSLDLLEGNFDATTALGRALYIIIAGIILALLADAEKKRRDDAAVVASVVRRAGTASGLEGAVESTLGAMLRTFGARRAVVAMKHVSTERVFLWDAVPAAASGLPIVSSSELLAADRDSYFFDAPGSSWHASRFRSSDWFDVLAFDADGNRLLTRTFTLPSSFQATHRCDTALGTAIAFGREWTGRLLLIDPEIGAERHAGLNRARRFALEIGAAANQEYLLGLLRARAAAVERARLARELHDGVVQSLIVTQMELEAARCKSLKEAPQFADTLARLQTILRDETVNLRHLTRELKNAPAGAQPLAGLVDIVSRFERETGIAARFYTEGALSVSPRSGDHVTRILQEGLTNVRKHSGARHVLVRAAARDGRLTLSIEDDGRGFPFSGRLSQAELAATHRGPAVMMERVRELGGDITVESKMGRGARVEVAVPL